MKPVCFVAKQEVFHWRPSRPLPRGAASGKTRGQVQPVRGILRKLEKYLHPGPCFIRFLEKYQITKKKSSFHLYNVF